MRITNKIIQRNNLSNINTNKVYQDKLSTQMSTQKKINRPSDDPVVAIRALRLRSNVTEITQYYTKNIPDAESWLKITEGALDNLTGVLTNMISRCNRGANTYLETADRKIILEEMENLGKEIYSTGDSDYAGRYVFTGYRTDTSLSFLKGQTEKYEITEQLDKSAIDFVIEVDSGDLKKLNATNFMDDSTATGIGEIKEKDITSSECYRIRLAYNDCQDYENGVPNITIKFQDPSVTSPNDPTVVWSGATGEISIKSYYENPYADVAAGTGDEIVYVPETGELLLGKNRYEALMATEDEDNTVANEGEIQITYEKSNWQKGDLRPEHYFACKTLELDENGNTKMEADADDPTKMNPVVKINYNQDYLSDNAERQIIEYDVGFNQTIRVNSTADECFKHGIGREVDDLVNAMQDVLDLEGVQSTIEGLMANVETDSEEAKTLQDQLDAVKKALTYAKDKEQRLFEKGLTTFQKYLDEANICVTDCGTRGSKLELIKSRMQNQKTTFETLKSENEDVDITEVAINLSSAELTYDAALMAAGKVMQSTLLNYI